MPGGHFPTCQYPGCQGEGAHLRVTWMPENTNNHRPVRAAARPAIPTEHAFWFAFGSLLLGFFLGVIYTAFVLGAGL